jgi:hypothetical protein
MDNASRGIQFLIEATEDYDRTDLGNGAARFEDLNLFVTIREVQAMDGGFMALFISEINAAVEREQPGMTVTCVGMGEDMSGAVGDAVGQWVLGVLPVLAHWRGKHACLSEASAVETAGGRFDLLAGPTIVRGGGDPEEHAQPFSELMRPALGGRKLAQRVHWLEFFACSSDDGSIDATCRLNNRDWSSGRQVLEQVASSWAPGEEPMHTCRQFAMLLPQQGDTQTIAAATFWQRLLGKA